MLFEELVKALVEEGADPERRDISANTSDILGSFFNYIIDIYIMIMKKYTSL